MARIDRIMSGEDQRPPEEKPRRPDPVKPTLRKEGEYSRRQEKREPVERPTKKRD